MVAVGGSILAMANSILAVADSVLAVDPAVRRDDRAVGLVAVAAVHDRFCSDRSVGGDAGIFRRLAERVLNGVAELVQRIAVMPFGLRRRREQGQPQQANESGYSAAQIKMCHPNPPVHRKRLKRAESSLPGTLRTQFLFSVST